MKQSEMNVYVFLFIHALLDNSVLSAVPNNIVFLETAIFSLSLLQGCCLAVCCLTMSLEILLEAALFVERQTQGKFFLQVMLFVICNFRHNFCSRNFINFYFRDGYS